jgi:3-oxoacyl-[acyl-carrier protein] reductase
MQLKDRVAIVTGGATGIGRATSLALAREGARIAVNFSRSEAEAHETVAAIAALGAEAIAVQADVSRQAEVDALVGQVVTAFGGVDLLVNNAGTTRFIPMADLDSVTDEVWDSILALNLIAPFRCARAVAPAMRAGGGGAIVSISSASGFTGDGSSLPYSVSKAALIGLTRSLARALAPEIRVCSVAPGIVRTRWVAGHEEHVDRLSKAALLQRTATSEDVAQMVCALLSQEAMTGQTVRVDGGLAL